MEGLSYLLARVNSNPSLVYAIPDGVDTLSKYDEFDVKFSVNPVPKAGSGEHDDER